MKSKMQYSQNWNLQKKTCEKENKKYKLEKIEMLYENLKL